MKIVGVVPVSEKFQKMRRVYDACVAAGIKVPDEVIVFFNDQEPNDRGVFIDMTQITGVITKESGFEIHLDQIPPDIRLIHIY